MDESLITESVYRIHKASNIHLQFNSSNEWAGLKLENVLGFPMLSMECDMRVRVTEINLPFKTHKNRVICEYTSDKQQVEYMIRLNVLRMMLTNIADELNVKFTIENPVYAEGNINRAVFYVYRPSEAEPFAGLITDYIGCRFDVAYIHKTNDQHTSTVDFYDTRRSIRDFVVKQTVKRTKRFGLF